MLLFSKIMGSCFQQEPIEKHIALIYGFFPDAKATSASEVGLVPLR